MVGEETLYAFFKNSVFSTRPLTCLVLHSISPGLSVRRIPLTRVPRFSVSEVPLTLRSLISVTESPS
ncbi:hypothetical protein ACVIGV_000612 [Rhizobium leguminosarum]